jgi:hypothetical protein
VGSVVENHPITFQITRLSFNQSTNQPINQSTKQPNHTDVCTTKIPKIPKQHRVHFSPLTPFTPKQHHPRPFGYLGTTKEKKESDGAKNETKLAA